MKIEVKRTDKRHTAYSNFKYYVKIKHDEWSERHLTREKFFELRQWCWETWGPSREADQYSDIAEAYLEDQNPAWAWLNDQYRARLYLCGKEEAAHFALKWS